MPTITVSRKVLERKIKRRLRDDVLLDRVSFLGTDVESVSEREIVVEVFPNRPDMLSEHGLARAFASFMGVEKGMKKYKVFPATEKVTVDRAVSKVRPFTFCAIMKGMQLDDEKIRDIIQIQEKLHVTLGRNRKKVAIGVYPLDKIKMPITFTARPPKDILFRPLEMTKEVNGLQIVQSHPAGREYAHLLDGKDRFPIFVDSNNRILSMPPIINSHDTGKVTSSTTDLFIECSGFDEWTLKKCLNILVCALADMGGEIHAVQIVYPNKKEISPKLDPETIKVDISYINQKLGMEFKGPECKRLLEMMGMDVVVQGGTLKVLVPPYRVDIMHPIDIVEDIAIAHGYDKFEPQLPNLFTIASEDEFSRFQNQIANMLVGFEFIEVNTYHLTQEDYQTTKMNMSKNLVEVKNPVSAEHHALRAWMIPTMLEVLRNNRQHEYPQKVFGMGSVFFSDSSTETGVGEKQHLALAVSADRATFTQMKQIVDSIMRNLNLEYDIEELEHGSFIQGRAASAQIGKKEIAYWGEIHPGVLENWQLDMPSIALEIDLEELFRAFKAKEGN